MSALLDFRSELTGGGWREGADRRLARLLGEAVASLAGEPPPGHAVVAVGGFGRGSLALRSDVDLLVLHRGEPDREFVGSLLRPLWDGRLRVGHAVRSPRATAAFAALDVVNLCPLLTMRPVAGDPMLFDELEGRLRRLVRGRQADLLARLEQEERERRAREPYRLMAADLKRGRGGVRTLDLVAWAGRLHALSGRDDDPEEGAGVEEPALREALQSFRCALHAAAGRPHETFDFDLRGPAARWLHTDPFEAGRRLLEVRRKVEELVEERLPDLAPARPRPRLGWAGPEGLPDLLRPSGTPGLRREAAGGWLEEALPEWARLLDVPHLVPFHRHPVWDHTLATVEEMRRLLDEGALGIDPAVIDRDLALWAALLHDLGKAGPGPGHAEAGARMAAEVGERLGRDPEDRDRLCRLVRHHLLLADLATTADLDDLDVVRRAAARLGDVATLEHLYLLTVADSRAAGPDTWTPWRADLLDRAYRRLREEMAGPERVGAEAVAGLAGRVLEAGAGRVTQEEVTAHLAGFDPEYRSSHDPESVLEHLLLARGPLDDGAAVAWVVTGTAARVVVVTADRPGLLAALAGWMALCRLSILDARLWTRADGRVFDTFEVLDAVGGDPPSGEALEAFASGLGKVLRGGVDLPAALTGRRRAYRAVERGGVPPVVTILRAEGARPGSRGRGVAVGGGSVRVEAPDRVGLLHDLGAVFADFGMPVVRARVDTRAGIAHDAFHVARLPSDPGRLVAALVEAAG